MKMKSVNKQNTCVLVGMVLSLFVMVSCIMERTYMDEVWLKNDSSQSIVIKSVWASLMTTQKYEILDTLPPQGEVLIAYKSFDESVKKRVMSDQMQEFSDQLQKIVSVMTLQEEEIEVDFYDRNNYEPQTTSEVNGDTETEITNWILSLADEDIVKLKK